MCRGVAETDPLRDRRHRRLGQGLAIGQDHHRQHRVRDLRQLQQLRRLAIGGDIEPLVRHLVARQEIAQLVRLGRPAVPDQANSLERRPVPRLPIIQQVAEHRVEALLRGIPRFHQVVIEMHIVDCLDRGVGIGIGGQQRALGIREVIGGRFEELDAGHAGHPLVGEEERHRFLG